MVETKMEPGPDLTGGVVRYMDDVLGLYAVHTSSKEEQVNKYFERVATSYPPPTGVEHSAIPRTSDHYRCRQAELSLMELCSSQHWQWRHCANETSDAGRRY